MKTLSKDELYQNLQGFLKAKGVELSEGSYARKIQKSCNLLSEAINTSQKGLARAKVEIDKKLDQVRQVIHEKTAPPGSSTAPPKEDTAPPKQTSAAEAEGKKPRSRKKKARKSRQ
jgi:hypothetical protein